jgi:hypothetical protein
MLHLMENLQKTIFEVIVYNFLTQLLENAKTCKGWFYSYFEFIEGLGLTEVFFGKEKDF